MPTDDASLSPSPQPSSTTTPTQSLSPTERNIKLFQSSIVFNVTDDILNTTDAEKKLFVRTFIESYNEGNALNPDIADPLRRFLVQGEVVSSGFTLVNSEDLRSNRRRKLQVLPPMIDFGFASLLASVTGICDGCENNTPVLGNDVTNRRRTLQRTLQGVEPNPDAVVRGPMAEDILPLFNGNLQEVLPELQVFNFTDVDEETAEVLATAEPGEIVIFDPLTGM
ncbi:MAG: hypothetical protein SGARI_000022, partial [Bacillariaceae sp.]